MSQEFWKEEKHACLYRGQLFGHGTIGVPVSIIAPLPLPALGFCELHFALALSWSVRDAGARYGPLAS